MEENMTVEFTGTVEEVIFSNADNHYAVIFLLNEKGEGMVAVGTMPFVHEGEEAKVSGVFKSHPEYGHQLVVSYYEKMMPRQSADILRYLSSGAIKGIGPKTAKAIVDRYGEDTFIVIEQHPDYLSDIPGISPKKAASIHKSFVEQEGVRRVMMLCRDHLTPSLAARVCKTLGKNAEEKIMDEYMKDWRK